MQDVATTGEDKSGLVGTTTQAITTLIRARGLAPGDRLPSEAVLSRDLQVSRTVIRESFRTLAALRLIELNTGRRATVAALDYGAMSPLIEHGVHIEQISIQQIYDVRRTIETRTATLSALRRTDAQARTILDHAQAMRDPDLDVVMERDIAFHLEIARAAQNPVFTLIVGAFEGVTRRTWPIGWRSRTDPVEREHMLVLHHDLAEAIGAGDPRAASDLMAQHFDRSVQALVKAGIS